MLHPLDEYPVHQTPLPMSQVGTSDKNWSDWKESLVWSLYRKTNEYLEVGPHWIEARRKAAVEYCAFLVPGERVPESVEWDGERVRLGG